MKKIIAMLLVLVMSVTGLVGCGSSNKSGSEAGSTSTSSDSDWAYIQGKGKLTVGIQYACSCRLGKDERPNYS